MKNKTMAVVTGMEVNGLGVARSLGRRGVPVIGVVRNDYQVGRFSRYLRQAWRCADHPDAVVETLLERGGQFDRKPVLFPIGDQTVRAIAAHRDALGRSYELPLPEAALVEAAMGKQGFFALAAAHGLDVPQTVCVRSVDDVRRAAGCIAYPCALKPDYRQAGFKVRVANDATGLLEAYAELARHTPEAVVQSWIPGGDDDVYFCLQYYGKGGERLAGFTGRKMRQWPAHSGIASSCRPARDAPEVECLTDRFFSGIGYRGLGSLELKRHAETGQWLAVEATIGRTDYLGPVADANGVPVPYVAYCDLAGEPLPPPRPGGRRCRWVAWGADRKAARYYRNAGTLSRAAWLWSLRPPVVWSVWAVDDPLPVLAPPVWRAVRKLWRMIGATC